MNEIKPPSRLKYSDDPELQQLYNQREKLCDSGDAEELKKVNKQIQLIRARKTNKKRYARKLEMFAMIF